MPDSAKTQEFSEGQHPPSLPSELEEMILSYVCDFDALLWCSLTCRGWRRLVVPRLHYSLTVLITGSELKEWPNPLKMLHEFCLLPYVKRLSILEGRCEDFTLELFCLCSLEYFSAFKNLRELSIDRLRVADFIPNIQQHFEHFAPTIESIALYLPLASCREILYFIGSFKNLQDFTLRDFHATKEDEVTANLALVPLSPPPPPRRWLTLEYVELVDGMVTLYGGFRYVALRRVGRIQRVIDACADTLEILELKNGEETFG